MAQFQSMILFVILVDAFMLLATANEAAPTNLLASKSAEVPSFRKLGKHRVEVVRSIAFVSAPSEAPQADEEGHSNNEANTPGQSTETEIKKQHHRLDRSVAGGGVILGGLATTFFVAIFCYIRATRRKTDEPIV